MQQKIGFIGGGQMAFAVASGFLSSGIILSDNMYVSNRSAEKLESFKELGMTVTQNNIKVFQECEIIILAIKPQVFPEIVEEYKQFKGNLDITNKLFVSVMGPTTIETIQNSFGSEAKVIRTLPNTPCLVKAGTILYCRNKYVPDKLYYEVVDLLKSCAEAFECPEHLIDAGSGIMGCGIAFLLTAVDALADGGVKHGLPRPLAIKLASRALYGTGKLACEADKHPCELRDAVASPGGTTICGLHALEKAGYRAALINAVEATIERAKELAKK